MYNNENYMGIKSEDTESKLEKYRNKLARLKQQIKEYVHVSITKLKT